mmetsp:Transcript_2810/g.3308  ORF Transcript_2810/g.3308 Transcript_2810/m.3308 type:complete len:505 (+) Transcript_2810:168-1682(+)
MAMRELVGKVTEGFTSLRGSPPELWKAYTLKFLDSYSYFSFSVIMTLFLSEDFGYSDLQAGTIYGAWGALVTLFGLSSGVIIDKLGVSVSLKLGFLISFIAKCVIFITASRIQLLLGIALLSFGGCLGIPVLAVGIRRYTTTENRGFAFGLFYVIMNFAALLSGPTVDFCTILYGDAEKKDEGHNDRFLEEGQEVPEWHLSGYRLVVLIGIIANVIACLVTLSVKEIKVVSSTVMESEINDQENKNGTNQNRTAATQSFQVSDASAMQILRETMTSPDFWRFLVVCMITLNIRMIFRHLDATLPKYMMREFGENVPKGTIYAINPALIMILVPLITAATSKVDPLIMIHHGCYISAFSVFFLVISTSITGCVLFVVVLSIGEAIWSPRLYDYTMQIAKEGREGTYMALSSAPLFLAKLPVGMMSGYLLQKYCPEEGPRNSKLMWLIIGLTTASSPVLLTCLWGYISKQSDNDDDEDGQTISYDEIPLSEIAPIHRRKRNVVSSN